MWSRIDFLPLCDPTVPRELLTKGEPYLRGCDWHWLSMHVIRRAAVEVTKSKCGVYRELPVIPAMAPFCTTKRFFEYSRCTENENLKSLCTSTCESVTVPLRKHQARRGLSFRVISRDIPFGPERAGDELHSLVS
jgi:hypothetical protein